MSIDDQQVLIHRRDLKEEWLMLRETIVATYSRRKN
jgi:hypothetical protein